MAVQAVIEPRISVYRFTGLINETERIPIFLVNSVLTCIVCTLHTELNFYAMILSFINSPE